MSFQRFERNLVRVGVVAGALAVVTYLAKTIFSLPGILETHFFIWRGPLLATAVVGFYPFLSKPAPSAAAIIGTVFGALSGAATMMFAVVQMTNVHAIFPSWRAAEGAEREQWRHIFDAVFSVQNGINYVADFFLDWMAFCYAVVMWNHPKFGKALSILALLLVGPHFVMKAVTFPEPPAEAGLFDAGPLVSIWFALVILQVIRHLRWTNE